MKKLGILAIFLLACSARAADAPEPPPQDWRDVDPSNLALIDTRYGEMAVELAPEFAPKHVERVRALIRAHFYDGLSFYRVIDGFVAQGGIGEGTASTKDHPKEAASLKQWPALKAEFERPIGNDVTFTPLGNGDLFAPEVGHVNGFPVGRDAKAGREWMIHCPGHVRLRARQRCRYRHHRVLHRDRRGAAALGPQPHRLWPRDRRHAISAEARARRPEGRERRHSGRCQARSDRADAIGFRYP